VCDAIRDRARVEWKSMLDYIAYAEQNLYARSTQLVGDKDPRHHEFTIQLRAFDASKSGAKLGVVRAL
jgi:ATP-dependent Lon protease